MPEPNYSRYGEELIKIGIRDQENRRTGLVKPWHDINNTNELRRIIKDIGLPSIPKVGSEAHFFGWQIAQHADHDVLFQAQYLNLLLKQPSNDIDRWQIAFLTDRILVNNGESQIYGTQFVRNGDGFFEPSPIKNLKTMNFQRAEYGLEPLDILMHGQHLDRKFRVHKIPTSDEQSAM